jgi:small subunit ribosomal protein S4
MARETQPKCKQCRRAGEKLFLKGERCNSAKCAIVRRNYPPGFHGPKGRGRLTDYALQLAEKQKAKRQYHLMEKQFRIAFDNAKSKQGNTADNFLQILEMRLDNVIYRAGFAKSRPQARQIVSHSLVTVNDRACNIPSRAMRSGDVIKIKNTKKNAKIFKDLESQLKKIEGVGWLNVDSSGPMIKVLHAPDAQAMQPNFSPQMIVEFYSR